MKKITLTILFVLVYTGFVFSQDTTDSMIKRRANDIIKILNEPKGFEKIFSKSFLTQVPPSQVKGLANKFVADYGKALKVQKVDKKDDYNAQIFILFEKDFLATMNLSLEQTGTNLISGLVITGVEKTTENLQSILDDLKKLSGKTSMAIAKIDGNKSQNIISHNADEHFAVGSTFKLYVLGELVKQITEGKRKWSDVVELKHFSLPSGQLQNFEKGSPVTLHTLASMMISVSDNTATDELMLLLGRENVEKMLKTAGNSKPELTKPFLTTSEMFRLKGIEDLKYAKSYVAADENGKRRILKNDIAKYSIKDIKLEGFLAKPTYISDIEWFASPNDLVRVMNWLKIISQKNSANKAFGVMSINTGIPPSIANEWDYVGYKGGGETGVISMTFLLKSKKGEWFVVTASWNDENNAVDGNKFALLVQSAIKILRKQIK